MTQPTVPVSRKVKWATFGSFAAGLGLALLAGVISAVTDHPEILTGIPTWAQILIIAAVTSAGAFVAGYKAHH